VFDLISRGGGGRDARPARARSSSRSAHDWRGTVQRRVAVVAAAFALWGVGIEAKLVYLQFVQRDWLVERAQRQQQRTMTAHPRRGDILDRAGRVLAYSVEASTIYAVPTEIDDPDGTASALCDALECSEGLRATIGARLSRDAQFVYVERQVTPAKARRVAALRLKGVGFTTEHRRYYPNKELAAHLLGYVGIDHQGLAGIESTYNDDISGEPGRILIRTDARGSAFSRVEVPPESGATLELTIDKYLQHIVERELRAGIREFDAEAGAVVVLDPTTGELLALASEPTFNPNVFSASSSAALRNRAVQDIYEPGSTFKVVTASAAFEERLVHRDEIFDVSDGYIRIAGDVIRDFRTYGQLSFTDVMVKSSNVGAIRVGLRLGPKLFSERVWRFGFGQALAHDFPSESPGIVWEAASLNERALASLSMGYQIAVTPLQMATAVAAIANGGDLIEARVVRAIRRGGEREEFGSRIIRRVVSRDTAAEMTAIMEAIAERGTARRARVPGYTVAGKTGTSEKLIDGRYSDTDHNASFVGFVPSRRPQLVVLVIIDTPRSAVINGTRQRAYTGGAVAAPIFRRIAEASLRHLAVPRNVDPIPAALSAERTEPRAMTVSMTPARTAAPQAAVADTEVEAMPDLRGLSAREAIQALTRLGLEARVEGNGVVVGQEPRPGAALVPGTVATTWMDRYPAAGDEQVAP
jgi:cell division protein FtsI (penicillin-binding protein 3)